MANLNIRSVNYNIERKFPSYIISTVVDCEYGHEGVKLINTPEELDKFYQGIKNREGLLQLLDEGASLYLTRLERAGTRNGTLRLLGSSYKYSHPLDYTNIEYDTDYRVSLLDEVTPDQISLHGTHTYSYVLDFGITEMVDEDYIAIPMLYEQDLDYDNSVLFYFTELNPVDFLNRKYPNDFTPGVPLRTLGSRSIAIDISGTVNKDDRAKIIYEWYLGILNPDNTKYELIGTQSDPNLIPELCELDEETNKVTLVFKKPIREIKYFKSNGANPFLIYSDKYLNQELISSADRENSIVTFRSKIQGDLDINVNLKYIKNFEFELELDIEETQEYHYITLDKDAPLYQGRSIYVEDVLDRDSEFLEASVHLGGRIYTELSDKYLPSAAAKLEGLYRISYGDKGLNLPEFIDGELVYPFQKSLDTLITSEKLSNLFLFNEFIDLDFQRDAVSKYLAPNTIIGIINIPEIYETDSDINNFMLEDSEREFILYTYGRFTLNGSIVNNSYYYAYNCITGNFKESVIDSTIPLDYNKDLNSYLIDKDINFLDVNKDYYFVNKIVNKDIFLEPHYLLVANYVKIYMTRFLSSKLGLYDNELKKLINIELSKVSDYSTLIESLTIQKFISKNNNLDLVLDLDLRGLIGSTLDVIIKINK